LSVAVAANFFESLKIWRVLLIELSETGKFKYGSRTKKSVETEARWDRHWDRYCNPNFGVEMGPAVIRSFQMEQFHRKSAFEGKADNLKTSKILAIKICGACC